jgi:hypothetical protein
MPLLRKNSVILAAIESTAGTAETLDATDGAFNAYETEATAAIDVTPRQGQGSASGLVAIPGVRVGQITFQVDLYKNAAWAAALLPSCGYEVSATTLWTKTSSTTNWKTVTIAKYIDGKEYQLFGAMGDMVILLRAGQVTRVQLTFTGVYDAANWGTDATLPTPTYPLAATAAIRFASSTTTLGGTAFGKWAAMDINTNNAVAMLEDITTLGGVYRAWINPSPVTGTVDPEEELAATRDDYGIWTASTEQALSIAYSDITLAALKLQFTDIQPGDRNGVSVNNITWQANRNAAAGNDAFTIDLDTTD